ncbi:hypothetical protein [Vibrio mediterranei]|uniref:hypothetical protein n=1 Tax=Vibrio mediterranei TaxID=689 RepID=UPI001EFD23E0|nr:hypothetical protein [Vibrio mediterranei]MCG9657639.1 hypothetical protein [Vibrio mediterranei]
MLSHDIYQDSQVYEVFNELYEQEEMHFNDFISGYLSLFDWYPLNCQELSGLPSGFRVDLNSSGLRPKTKTRNLSRLSPSIHSSL